MANSADAQAVRLLLPSTAHSLAYCLIVESGEPRKIVAAGGLTRLQRPKPLLGPAVALQVIAPFRRRGIGRSLISQLAARAQATGAAAVYAPQKIELNSEEFVAWSALGFEACETVEYHELPLAEFEPQLAPLLERLRERGKIPNQARIVPLYAADAGDVLRLHLDELGGDPVSLGKRLRGEVPKSFTPRYSRVLMLGDRVAGFILGHRVSSDVVYVDANVLAADIRGRWANIWLKLEATRGALAWGIEKFVFNTFDHYADTRSFTHKMRGITVRTTVLMYRPLSTP